MERFKNLQFHVQTDVGVTRDHNEDAVGLFEPRGGHNAVLLVVADGMGGEAAGEVASKMLIDSFEGYTNSEEDTEHRAAMAARIEHANREIVTLASQHPAMKGMGSTVVAARFDEDGSVDFVHVGDSRLYAFRDGSIERVTRDHSRVQLFVDEGILTPEQAERHPEANVLTQAVGRESVRVDRNKDKQLSWHDATVLICSDGLTGMLPESVIAHAMASLEVEDLTDALIEECNRLGATDNISIAVLRDGEPVAPMTRAAFHREVPVWIAAHEFLVRQQEEKDDQARQQREADAKAQAEAREAQKAEEKEAWDRAADASLGGHGSSEGGPPRRQTSNKRARYLIMAALLLALAAAAVFWFVELREPAPDTDRAPAESSNQNADRDQSGESTPAQEPPAATAAGDRADSTKPGSDDSEGALDPDDGQVSRPAAEVPGTVAGSPSADEPAQQTREAAPERAPEAREPGRTQPRSPQTSDDSQSRPSTPAPSSTSDSLEPRRGAPQIEERPARLGGESPARPSYELPDGPTDTPSQQGEPLRPSDKNLRE